EQRTRLPHERHIWEAARPLARRLDDRALAAIVPPRHAPQLNRHARPPRPARRAPRRCPHPEPARPSPRRGGGARRRCAARSEEHTSELQARENLVSRLLLEKKRREPRSAH